MSALRPNTNKGHDLGSSSKKWNELHVGDVLAETLTTTGNVEIAGNLTVTGTQTSLQVSTVEAEDPMIKLARNNSGDVLDIGFYGQSNDGSDKYHGIARDADDGKFYLFKDLGTEPSTTIPTLSAGNKATIVANIEGDITGDMTGNADTASAWASSRTVEFTGGDVAGSFSIDGSSDVSSIALTIQSNSVENGMIQNPGLLVGQSGGTPAIINLGNSLEIGGTANEVEVSYSPGEFTIGLPSTISGLTSVSATGFTGALTGNASTASALETARTIEISGDVAGSASFDGSAAIDIVATIQGSSVDNSMLANNGLDIYVDGVSQERVQLGEKLDFNGTASQVDVTYSGVDNDLTFSLPSTINVDTSGNAATATALETARSFSINSSEIVAGAQSFDGTGSIILSPSIQAGSVANSKLANSDIGFGNGVSSSDIALGGDVVIQGTSAEVEVGYSAGTFTIGLPDNISADLTGNADTATALETARNFSIGSGPVQAAAVSFDGTGAVSLTTTIADDQITNDMLANDKLVIQVDGVDHDRALGSTLKFAKGGDLEINYSASENEITYTLPAILTADTTGNAATATALETARNFSISSGPVQASGISFDGTGNVSLTSSIADDQITNAMIANPGINIKIDGSASELVELGEDLDFTAGTDLDVSYNVATNKVTFSLEAEIGSDTTGNAATATALETSRDIQLTGDVVGTASFDGTANASISTSIANGAVDNVMLANSSITVSDTSNSEAIALGDTLYFGGTSSEVEVSYNSSINKFTFGLPDSVTVSTNLDVGSALSVGGNISATGNISAAGLTATGANITFADNLIEFGVNNTDLEDIGFYGQRGDGIGGSNGFAGFAWDESSSQFMAFTSTGEPTTTVGTNTKANLAVANVICQDVIATGDLRGKHRMLGSAPSSSSDTGSAGDMRFDADYMYICTATNTWKRIALSTF